MNSSTWTSIQSQVRPIVVALLILVLVGCDWGSPNSRKAADRWLLRNWETARPYAERIKTLCEKNPDVRSIRMDRELTAEVVSDEVYEEARVLMPNIPVGSINCRADGGVFLFVGSNVEANAIQFNGAYHYYNDHRSRGPGCDDRLYTTSNTDGSCGNYLGAGWYYSLVWYDLQR